MDTLTGFCHEVGAEPTLGRSIFSCHACKPTRCSVVRHRLPAAAWPECCVPCVEGSLQCLEQLQRRDQAAICIAGYQLCSRHRQRDSSRPWSQ